MSKDFTSFWKRYLETTIAWSEYSIQSADGTTLRCQKIGESQEAMIFVPGMVPTLAHLPIVQHFVKQFSFLTWQTRGTFSSSTPKQWSIASQAQDLLAAMDNAGVSSGFLVGWGVAAQVCLAFAHEHPERCKGMLLINAAPGRPLHWSSGMGRWIAGFTRLRSFLPGQGGASLLPKLVRMLSRVEQRTGLLPDTYALWMDVGELFVSQPPHVIHALIQAAEEHDTEDFLPTLKIPSLVTLSPNDILPSPQASQRLHNLLPVSERFAWERGGHYAPVLYPEPLNEALSDFLSKHIE